MSIQKCLPSNNLFDISTAVLGKYIDNSGNEQSSSAQLPSQSLNHSDYIAILSNQVYTFSSVKDTTVQQTVAFVWYTANKTFISITTEVKPVGTTNYSITATSPSNAEYAIINFTTANNEVMLNTGSTPLPYEPYGNSFKNWFYRKRETATDTITTFPKQIIADGQSASAVIKGNMSQTGTPTPASPIYPSETGDRTENLFNSATATLNARVYTNRTEAIEGYAYSDYINVEGMDYISINLLASITTFYFYADKSDNAISYGNTQTIAIPQNAKYVRFNININDVNSIILLSGSTAPSSYIPYGFKIPILSGGVTTPVYLGEVQSERQIKKLVLTGEETGWNVDSTNLWHLNINNVPATSIEGSPSLYCTHYDGVESKNTYSGLTDGKACIRSSGNYIWIRDSQFANLNEFKTWLAQQYDNGTPVTVWYVLATPQTTTLNEPIRKIGNYADSVSVTGIPTTGTAEQFDIDTDMKPSEVDLTYHGWHEHQDTKFTG